MFRPFSACSIPFALLVGNAFADDQHKTEAREKRMERHEPFLHLVHAVQTQIEMAACGEGNVQQLQEVYDAMRKLDPNNTGRIDLNALKAEADQVRRHRVQRVFQELDVNHNGKISREEARGLIKEHFDRIDKNKDGFITLDELLEAAKERCDQNAANTQATDHQHSEQGRR